MRRIDSDIATSEYAPFLDYDLPPHLIAQEPCSERDRSRLLVAERGSGALSHRHFQDLAQLLSPGDLLVLNDTRVVPARLVGRRTRTGGRWEGLFLRHSAEGWELLSQTRGRLLEGETITIEPGPLTMTLVRKTPERHWIAVPDVPGGAAADPLPLLHQFGKVPLPPYVRKGLAKEADVERYQTVYARQPGAVAAPTAGLHFTPRVFAELEQRGIGTAFVTLHVGLGTFQPIQVDDFRQHRMHAEWGELSAATAQALAGCRARGNRVVAVGTTAVRVLETVAATGPPRAWSGETELFIYPPYPFRCVDALITNFHLPRTSLLLLVGAFAGADLLRRAYMMAREQEYRFYSYGDAMIIL
jgi:S-adenosylmethionine:tRNA ribosyltransferase-isomerase